MVLPGTMIWLSAAERDAVQLAIAQFMVDSEERGEVTIGEAVVRVDCLPYGYRVWIAYLVAGEGQRRVSYYLAPLGNREESN